MRSIAGQRVLLGVTGGIASYKTVSLARLLTQAGARVDVVMSRSAREFVGAVTFEALTGRPVHVDLIADGHALDHIRLAQDTDLVVVAPATADFIARAGQGRADDLLTAILLATRAPVLVAPAMNDQMWTHPQTASNVAHLRSLGYRVLDPAVGPLASADEGVGPGRMREPEEIFDAAVAAMATPSSLAGRTVVVTAGPTREAIDPVRFISNRSSGKMGVAVAKAAAARGAHVILIAGPLEVAVPSGVHVVRVESTAELEAAVRSALRGADALVMAAAPADFRPSSVAHQKIKKATAPPAIPLELSPDILASTRDARESGTVIVGFALETENLVANAQAKLAAKALDLVVANQAGETGSGFGSDTNRVTLIGRDGSVEALPLASKDSVACTIVDRVEQLLSGR
ncbi:MAG: bifunctional phosphopantothenoylcysteine decarboxylase/phosphopantothenate--cysteine ligase CoaBC [Gemmatimonadetes bacterium]|nr:bifunctional phosphopantothenoylcysteine decarboxylase/phosphopantothenate--cysteine ligase CoaBC [Gemmatimonadota bacterium]